MVFHWEVGMCSASLGFSDQHVLSIPVRGDDAACLPPPLPPPKPFIMAFHVELGMCRASLALPE